MGSGDDGWPFGGMLEWASDAHQQLEGTGLASITPEVVRSTPWSTVVRWKVRDSWVWGKAACPGFAAECGLLPLIAQRSPNLVLAPIAVDVEHGWMLLPDGGETLEGTSDVDTWTRALKSYSELQMSMVNETGAMLEVGCPDMRPHAAVGRLEQMMADGSVPEHRWLVDAAKGVASRLDTELIPATVQHDDLNPDNVFVDGRVFDWGDASVAHPFASLLTALWPNRPGSAAEKSRMRDAYLGSWQEFLGQDRAIPRIKMLQEQATLAVMLAPIGRIDCWLRAPAQALVLYPYAVDRWLQHMLDTKWP